MKKEREAREKVEFEKKKEKDLLAFQAMIEAEKREEESRNILKGKTNLTVIEEFPEINLEQKAEELGVPIDDMDKFN